MRKRRGRKRATGTRAPLLTVSVPNARWSVDFVHDQFAHDVPAEASALMAVGQRPIAEAALAEESGEPAWKALPSYFVYGDSDKNIPAKALGFMAERAGSRRTVVVEGASHVVMVSHPKVVTDLIEEAAK